ncbi:hypothetical protein B0H14DRAFT_2851084 [Mycena olivaceomarginata]|nr:hypothetical protein B0H14DRAFT_2851084 [Mycena olivaceomarginata]
MKTAVLSSLATVAVVGAHNVGRQASSSAAAPPASAPAGTSVGTAPASVQTSFSFTLASTNPTAIPLGNNSRSIIHIRSALLAPSAYPALDVIVPTDSPEVKQWILDVNNSGVAIPSIAPTVAGGCPANAAAAADQSRCWWTCTGCVADTDITTCPDKMTWGGSFDDGPSLQVISFLMCLRVHARPSRIPRQNNIKTTFFAVGSRVISFPAILQTEYMEGHQVAVHTLPYITDTNKCTNRLPYLQTRASVGWSKKVIKDVLGVTPTHFRPPFGDIDNRVRAIAKAMDLTPVIWTRISPLATFDTDDFDLHSGLTSASHVLQNWDFIASNATSSDFKTGFILLEHDLFQQSVDIATGYIYPDALARQPPFKIEPIISCLNQPLGNAYIETNDNSSNPLPISATTVVTGSATGSATGSSTGGSGNGNSAVSTIGLPGLGPVLALALALLSGTSFLLL